MAVVLTLGEDGTPGAVYGIGEDLALRLAALDLPSYLQRYADALETAVTGIDARLRELYDEDALDDEELRADVAEQLLDAQLYAAILGMGEEDDTDVVPLRSLSGDPGSASENAPAGAVAVADLRGAAPGAMVDVMNADLPGDPLGQQVEWRDGGLLVYVVAE